MAEEEFYIERKIVKRGKQRIVLTPEELEKAYYFYAFMKKLDERMGRK